MILNQLKLEPFILIIFNGQLIYLALCAYYAPNYTLKLNHKSWIVFYHLLLNHIYNNIRKMSFVRKILNKFMLLFTR